MVFWDFDDFVRNWHLYTVTHETLLHNTNIKFSIHYFFFCRLVPQAVASLPVSSLSRDFMIPTLARSWSHVSLWNFHMHKMWNKWFRSFLTGMIWSLWMLAGWETTLGSLGRNLVDKSFHQLHKNSFHFQFDSRIFRSVIDEWKETTIAAFY